ncbi:MAG: hypothetical protein J5542_02225 [Bacteroidales bacterium]|jgi:hypothetical protein|nr:hypothetical protein [Bacteroidales bacterium]
MSEKKWKIDSRVPSRYRECRRRKGSEFPRHGMDEYEGKRLSMNKHCRSKRSIRTYRYHWAYLPQRLIDGLLKKYLNCPFNDLLSEFYAKTKSLRRSRKQCMSATLRYFETKVEDEHTQFLYRQGGKRDFYIDDSGILRQTEKINRIEQQPE